WRSGWEPASASLIVRLIRFRPRWPRPAFVQQGRFAPTAPAPACDSPVPIRCSLQSAAAGGASGDGNVRDGIAPRVGRVEVPPLARVRAKPFGGHRAVE